MDKYSRKAVSKALVAQVLLCPGSISKHFYDKSFRLNSLKFELRDWGPGFSRWRATHPSINGEEWLTWKESRQLSKLWKKWKYEHENQEQIQRRQDFLKEAGYKNVE